MKKIIYGWCFMDGKILKSTEQILSKNKWFKLTHTILLCESITHGHNSVCTWLDECGPFLCLSTIAPVPFAYIHQDWTKDVTF